MNYMDIESKRKKDGVEADGRNKKRMPLFIGGREQSPSNPSVTCEIVPLFIPVQWEQIEEMIRMPCSQSGNLRKLHIKDKNLSQCVVFLY
jgi:hypothetical protein